jgi:hypothetical protein
MTVCPSCGAPATDSGKPSRRQFYACESYSYDGDALTDQTDLCRAWQAIRNVRNVVTTDSETKEQLIARVRELLQE